MSRSATCWSAPSSASRTGRASRVARSRWTPPRTCSRPSIPCAADRRSATSSTTRCAIGAGQIRISARRQNGLLQIAVSDAGEGFPPELAPHAFERFARGDGARARSGTGIGLSIVRAIAEAHGGTAVIVDTPSGGATVQLSVPVAHESANNAG